MYFTGAETDYSNELVNVLRKTILDLKFFLKYGELDFNKSFSNCKLLEKWQGYVFIYNFYIVPIISSVLGT